MPYLTENTPNVNPAILLTKVLYPISRRTSPNSDFARHLPSSDAPGLPMCRASRRRVFSWEEAIDVPTCKDCLRLAAGGTKCETR